MPTGIPNRKREEGEPIGNPSAIRKLTRKAAVYSRPTTDFRIQASESVSKRPVASTRRGQQGEPSHLDDGERGCGEWGFCITDAIGTYLREIGAIPLLTAERERELAERVARGDEVAKKQFIEANLRLVIRVVKAVRPNQSNFLDFVQAGNMGLMHAVEKFDYKKGYRFSTYATDWIMQAVRIEKANDRIIHIPIHIIEVLNNLNAIEQALYEETGQKPSYDVIADRAKVPKETVITLLRVDEEVASLDVNVSEHNDEPATLADYLEAPPQLRRNHAEDETNHELVENLLSVLDPRKRKVIEMLYGLGEHEGNPHTRQEVASELGVTPEAIRVAEISALRRMKYPYTTSSESAVMTEPVILKLEEAFKGGRTDKEACKYAQISVNIYYKFKREDKVFAERMISAKQSFHQV